MTPFLEADAPAVDTAAVVTLAKAAGSRFTILAIYFSYSLGTPVGALTITGLRDEAGEPVTFDMDVDGIGSGELKLHGLAGDDREDVVVTLEAPTGSSIGRLNVVAVKGNIKPVAGH